MESKSSALLCLALFLVFSSATAFDIVKILEKQKDLSNFATYLKDTKLGDQINSRSTITVLAVSNGGIASLAGKSQDVVKKILSAHVILDYYDDQKLTKLTKTSKVNTLTTMFQSSGQANNQQGFVNVGMINEGEIAFGSAVKGSKLNAKLVKSVVSQPFNLSVLEVSEVINVDVSSSASSPAGSPKSSASPSPDSSDDKAPSASPKSSKSKKSPSSDEVSSPPVSGEAPTGSSSSSPAAAPSAASSSQMAVGAVVVMMGLASLLIA